MDNNSVIGAKVSWRSWEWLVVKPCNNGVSYRCKILKICDQLTDLDRQVQAELERKGWLPGFEFDILSSTLVAITKKDSPQLAAAINDSIIADQKRGNNGQAFMRSFWR